MPNDKENIYFAGMDSERRKQLEEKRHQLQEKMEREKQVEQHAYLTDYLEKEGFWYKFIFDYSASYQLDKLMNRQVYEIFGELRNFLHLDWSGVENIQKYTDLNEEKRDSLLNEIIRQFSDDKDRISIIYYLANKPDVITEARAFLNNPDIFLAKYSTWILPDDHSFIIEINYDANYLNWVKMG